MENLEPECAISCPGCGEVKFILRRQPTGKNGSCAHVLEKRSSQDDHKRCQACDVPLVRAPLPEGVRGGRQ
jgi:hypothetical protein